MKSAHKKCKPVHNVDQDKDGYRMLVFPFYIEGAPAGCNHCGLTNCGQKQFLLSAAARLRLVKNQDHYYTIVSQERYICMGCHGDLENYNDVCSRWAADNGNMSPVFSYQAFKAYYSHLIRAVRRAIGRRTYEEAQRHFFRLWEIQGTADSLLDEALLTLKKQSESFFKR